MSPPSEDFVVHRVEVDLGDGEPVRVPDFAAGPGGLVVIDGPPGCGKSSVLEVLAGYRRPARGEVRLLGRPIDDTARTGIAVVAQTHDLMPTLTALENVVLAALPTASDRNAAWQRAVELLDRLALPRAAQTNLAEELSGGQHQRVALARALVAEPVLLIADDPTSELDEASRALAVDALTASARTIVVVTGSDPLLHERAATVVRLSGRGVSRG